ncbi:hypothetical protein JZU68_03595, partial [bacterium]|nr:hypothetical protein [bacterium]
ISYNIPKESGGLYLGKGWEDLQGSLVGKNLNAVPGTVHQNYTNNSLTFNPSGNVLLDTDVVNFNFQYPHGAQPDGEMRVHIHWEQPNATQRIWTMQYRIQKNGQAKTTLWTTIQADSLTQSKFAYISGTLNQITSFNPISLLSAGLSAVVEFRLTRSDANAGNIEATFVDAHVY